MAKTRSVYSYLDKTQQLNIKELSNHLWNGNEWRSFWDWGNENRVFLTLSCKETSATLTLYYSVDKVDFTCPIKIISKPSNLGKGKGILWFFVCPVSGKHCRILYRVNERFVHRQAYPGQHYYHQTISKKWRLIDDVNNRSEDAIAKIKPRTLRTYYKGEFTKRYLRYIRARMKWDRVWSNVFRDVTERLEIDDPFHVELFD
jgi:predicted DNA binding protein